jgi:hypothetical protein
MRQPVPENGMQSLVGQYFQDIARGGVFLEDHIYRIRPAGAFAREGEWGP